MKEFEKLGMSKGLIDVLEKMRIEAPSEIQAKAIPLVLAGKDIIGGSATGSGKTLVFSSAIIENLKPNNSVQALILEPTRELAEQVADAIKKFSNYKKLNVLPIYGGVDIERQIRKLAVADIIVGTPGRIIDHINRRTLRLDEVKFLVLDEVDRMFDMGFHIDVEKIIKECPEKRQTMLFSATISSDIDYLAQKYTKNPVEVAVESYVDATKLKQRYYDVDGHLKFSLLVHLLEKEKSDLVMVFCSTRRNVDFVAGNLIRKSIKAKAIHGGLNQSKRTKVLEEFHGKGVGVLVCTDVAARGLDIKLVSHVYNYDLPKTSDEYIHRIGRTARAGKEGKAISLLCNRDYENFGNILKDEKIKITLIQTPWIKKLETISEERPRRNFRGDNQRDNFRRGSKQESSRGRPQGFRDKPKKDYSRGNPRQNSRKNNSGVGKRRY